jgi:uncharacterized protein (TIGR01777 family)
VIIGGVSMRVVITGGTGLIGRALTESLITDGHDVIVLSRNPEKARKLPQKVSVVKWSLNGDDSWYNSIDGAHAIVNLAGANLAGKRWSGDYKKKILSSRVNAGHAVVRAVEAAKKKPRVLIQASGIGYYGDHGNEEINEEIMAGSGFLAQVALKWEPSTDAVERMGVRRTVIRTGMVLSRHGGALPLMQIPYRFFIGGPLGSGRQWWPWIHMVDEVRAIRFLIENKNGRGPYNFVAPGVVTNREFSSIVGRTIGRPSCVRVPEFALRTLLGEKASVVFLSQRAIPERLLGEGFTFTFETAKDALRDLLK